MDINTAVVICAVVAAASVAGIIFDIVVLKRRRDFVVGIGKPSDWKGRARSLATDGPKIASVVVLASTLLPWVSGSAVGVALPPTLWGLPWVRWPVGVAALLAAVLAWATPYRRTAAANIGCAAGFMVCVWLGTVMFLLTVIAESVSHYTFVVDTYLRGVGLSDSVLPVVREGVGAPVYSLAALGGLFATALCFRRRGGYASQTHEADSVVADDPLFSNAAAEITVTTDSRPEVGDEWWR